MKKISVGLRLGTMLLDHLIICFIGIPLLIISDFAKSSDGIFASISPYSMMPLFVIYFCKDCIGGRSPAKRILKLAVVSYNSDSAANPFRSLVRDLFILIWPIEVLVALFNQERRIGDQVAGTRLTYYNPGNTQRLNILEIVGVILIATAFTYVLIRLIDSF